MVDDVETLSFLHFLELSPAEKIVKRKDKQHLWDLPDQDYDESNIFSNATLDQLIVRLTPQTGTVDQNFVTAFLTTSISFCTPRQLVCKLQERWEVPKGKLHTGQEKFIKSRVLNVILKYLKQNYYHIDDVLKDSLLQFAEKDVKDQGFPGQSKQMIDELGKDYYDLPKKLKMALPSTIPTFHGEIRPYGCVFVADEKTIAEQLTLLEFEIYKRIQPPELLGQAWSKEKQQCLGRNVIELITRANKVSFWVASTILLQPKMKDRVKAISQYIAIGRELVLLRNYNTLMGILAGLSTSAVSRLKKSFAALDSKAIKTYDEIQLLMNPSKSFKTLRETIQEACAQSMVPYIGLYLADLTFIDEGNQDILNPSEPTAAPIINMQKQEMVHRAIEGLLDAQKNGQHFKTIEKIIPIFTLMFELPVLQTDDLWDLSLLREPRLPQST